MSDQKVVEMKLKVDLNCSKCYKKCKKALCKFPEIGDLHYDDKSNEVIIKAVCDHPENLMDKLCYKEDGFIKSIDIPPKPRAPASALAPVPTLVPATVPVLVPAPVPEPELIWQHYHIPAVMLHPCPYYETPYYHQCYGSPVCEHWEGGGQGCSIM